MGDADSRFEFRIWGNELGALRVRMESAGTGGPPRSSEETYILSRATDASNVKIRGGLVDIKQLVEVRDGLERWTPTLKASFPIETRVVVEQVMPALRTAPPPIARLSLTLEEFIGDIVESNPDLRAVAIAKTRFGFEIGGCIAEYAEVRIAGGDSSQTVAVESANCQAIRAVIAKLGLGPAANVNYIKYLKLQAGFAVS